VRFRELLAEPVRNGVYKEKAFHGRGCKVVNMGELFAFPRMGDIPMKRVQLTEKELAKSSLRAGDLLFARRSLVASGAGRCSLVMSVSEPTTFESSIIRARPRPELARSEYPYYYFESPVGRAVMSQILRQVAVSGITGSDLMELELVIPCLSEQCQAAAILGTIDDRIAFLRETNATLEAIAQALFKSWFVDFDPVHAKQQGLAPAGMDEATAALFPDSFEESALGLVPRGWATGTVDSLMELAYGKALKATDRVAGVVPVYGSGGITGNHNESLSLGPSVVVGRKGTVGSLYWEDRPFFPIDTVFYVKAKVPLTYCFYQLRLLGLEKMNTDGAVPGLNRNNVYRLTVVVPPREVLLAFDEIVRAIRDRILVNVMQAQTLATLRDTLLPRLISGQLRLPDAEALAA
jgi:type I restriction enzyme, S subunit